MLTKLLTQSKKLIYQKVVTEDPATIITSQQNKKNRKTLNPRHSAELSFRIQMCIASGQAHEFHNRHNDLSPVQPLMRSIIRDLNRLRTVAPEEEIRFSYMLNQTNTSNTPTANPHFAQIANNAKSNSSLYNETIVVE